MGDGVIIGPDITLRCPGRISIGNNVIIDGNVVLDGKGENSKIEIGNGAFIGKNSILSCSSSTIEFGNNVSIGPNCYVKASKGSIKIGNYVTIGSNSVIISGNPDYQRLDIPMMKQDGRAKGINIGDDVWAGVGVKIIDGVNIGDGSVLGAGAVVIKDVQSFSISVGVPAKIIGTRR
jgi:acetyltransferase-like isoleucine patch superfamily enzyme